VLRSPELDIDKLDYDLNKSIEASLAVEYSLLNRVDEQWQLEQTFRKTREDMGPVGDLTASALRGLDSTASWNLKLGLVVKTPLLDRGDGLRETQAYRVARDNLAIQKQADTLDVRRDLAQRLGELGEIRRQVQMAQEGRELSQRIYQIDLRRFDLGLITSITLIESEDDAFNAELEASRQALRWIKAVRYLETRYRMVKSTGAHP
jgi:outer membrane protein TolC